MEPDAHAVIDGKYRIVRRIGTGAMGSVFEGEHVRIGRRVAIKILHETLARDRRLVARFEREAQAAARVASRHVADVLDLGDLPTGERYMVMEYLDGQTLADRLKAVGVLSPEEIVPVALQLLDGLARIHAAQIVHRDLKPANVFLSRDGVVKILDFGVCKFHGSGLAWATVASTVLGTPGYMAPEQVVGTQVDARADLYAVGALIYRCATSRLPFEAASLSRLLLKIRDGSPTHLDEIAPELDEGFKAIVMKAIARDRADRFQTAGELADALRAWSARCTIGNIGRIGNEPEGAVRNVSGTVVDALDGNPPRRSPRIAAMALGSFVGVAAGATLWAAFFR